VERGVQHVPSCYHTAANGPEAMSVADLHETWAWVMIGSNAFTGAWATAAHWLAPLRVRALWWFVILAEITVVVQVVLGVWMVSEQHLHVRDFHMLYGFAALITVGILYAYRSQLRAWLYLLYGLGGLFLMGLGLRAIVVGH
jgi:hypothetical protein